MEMPDTQKLKKRLRRKVHYDTAVLVLMCLSCTGLLTSGEPE